MFVTGSKPDTCDAFTGCLVIVCLCVLISMGVGLVIIAGYLLFGE